MWSCGGGSSPSTKPPNAVAHSLARTLREVCWYPEHDPRKASREYRQVHQHLVVELDTPCWICGIRYSTGGKMETHHAEIEWAAEMAFEQDESMLVKLVEDMHHMIKACTPEALRDFLDSEGNMLVLCAVHHRAPGQGIHQISYPCWKLQRYQYADERAFQFVRPPLPSVR